jgi:hypothetical protein
MGLDEQQRRPTNLLTGPPFMDDLRRGGRSPGKMSFMPTPPPEFRQRAVELIRQGTPVSKIARDLGISDSRLRNWMLQADAEDMDLVVDALAMAVTRWQSRDDSTILHSDHGPVYFLGVREKAP